MNTWKTKLAVMLAAVTILVGSSISALADTPPLVSSDWLAKNLNTPGIVILDVGAFTHYNKNHIPGAVKAFGPWQTMNEKFVGFMMPKPDVLEAMLRSYGVNNDSQIILYDEGVTATDTCKSARALWTLHTLGHDKVSILNGGFAAWEQEEKPVSKEAKTPGRGNFTAKMVAAKLISLEEVKAKIKAGKSVLLDNRSATEFFGHEKKSHIKRYGHLLKARIWPASYMSDAGVSLSPAFMKNTETLTQMAAGVGIPADKNVEIITYSNHGLQASLGYFVLHDLLGYTNVKIFDGSILEAADDKDVSMERYAWGYMTH
ncbi:MAG: hypothetical protein COZ12_00765 [Deltaproteobacteria bacterium CG_4_10_14_3_um_filter_60_8]|nr:MAG: hypothetical protein AUK28_00260 [Desulfobacterales bacterium CG2_30_60_27]PIP43551.1 MAG: hypothetical protein COX17_06325 [Deltaproteobacteria bacterium CG23_combo_of_CG06-09_8_20_14_all_60_8]PIY24768.1 MAG: hypothetical protein COZ12_00765 [Deltaproteobacteria bacterium CG_4_10_14_3_um_filter_60_8]